MEAHHPFDLRGKVIVVTGASSGIGRQCAVSCSRMGAKVILIARNEARLSETLSLMDHAHHQILPMDLTEAVETEEKLAALKDLGGIHGVIHSAGISTTLPLRNISEDKLSNFFKTNVNASINLTRLLTRPGYAAKEGASVVFITSVMGVVGEAGKTLYSLTKGALVAGVKSLALELAPKKIRVNCVSPGVVVTPMSSNAVYSQDEASLEKIRSYHPLGLGEAEDVANACVFLLSDASRWITGTNLMVDGGYTAR